MGLHNKALAILTAAMFMAGQLANAQTLAAPTGEVMLTVSGKISQTNGEGVAQFDRALLDSLPQHSFATSTIWTEGVITYQGVLLADLLTAVGASGSHLNAVAINDYQIDIPFSDIKSDGPLLAYLADGKPMSVRDKGPIWVIFPYDDVAAYRSEKTYAQSIWQLGRIETKD